MATTDDAGVRVLAIITHVLGYFTSFIGPLIVLVAAEREPAKQHARRALNWQLSYVIYGILLAIIMLVSIPLMIIGIGFVTLTLSITALIALNIADLIFIIIAAVRASEDRLYDYPLTIRFVKDPKGRARTSEPVRPSPTANKTTKRSSKRSNVKSTSKRSKTSSTKTGSKK